MLANETGWSADYILRRLPIALGLQIILWHDLKQGRRMKWSVVMKNNQQAVDIAADIKATLAKVSQYES